MRTNNQKAKLLHIARMFWEQTDEDHTLTVKQIIAQLDAMGIRADRRTVYDDMETLRALGMDIVRQKGKTFDYFLGSRTFELPELKLLVDAVQSSKFLTEKKSAQLIEKLESLTSRPQAKQLAREVYVSHRVKTMNESIYYNVDRIHMAIGADRQIDFQYYEYTLDKKLRFKRDGAIYTVSPYQLIWEDENYYMVAYHPRYDTLSHFRVDKMAHIRITDQPRRPLERPFDAGEYAKRMFGMFAGEQQTVQVAFAAPLIGVVIDRFGKEIITAALPDGRFTAQFQTALSPGFFAWLMQFGRQAEILAPAAARQAFVGHVRDTLCLYEEQQTHQTADCQK